MRDKKTYIVLIVIVVVFFVVMFAFFGLQSLRENSQESVFIVGDSSVWAYSKKKWYTISSTSALKKLDWKKYQIFLDNKKFGKYYLWNDSEKWYAFDNDKNAVKLEGNMFAYNANYDINVHDYTLDKIDDNNEYVNQVLEKNGLSISSKFTAANKVSFDFDNDGNIEDFYLITNVFPLDFKPDITFSLVFMVKNNTIYDIYTDVSENETFDGCKPYFNTFFDYNDDNTYEFVLSCARYSVSEQIDMLYRFSDNKFKIIISS